MMIYSDTMENINYSDKIEEVLFIYNIMISNLKLNLSEVMIIINIEI